MTRNSTPRSQHARQRSTPEIYDSIETEKSDHDTGIESSQEVKIKKEAVDGPAQASPQLSVAQDLTNPTEEPARRENPDAMAICNMLNSAAGGNPEPATGHTKLSSPASIDAPVKSPIPTSNNEIQASPTPPTGQAYAGTHTEISPNLRNNESPEGTPTATMQAHGSSSYISIHGSGNSPTPTPSNENQASPGQAYSSSHASFHGFDNNSNPFANGSQTSTLTATGQVHGSKYSPGHTSNNTPNPTSSSVVINSSPSASHVHDLSRVLRNVTSPPRSVSPVVLPTTRELLDQSEDKVLFYEVLEMYMMEGFTPIATTVGLTPEATVQMAQKMGLEGIRNLVSTTEKPWSGYSPLDPLSDFRREGVQVPMKWQLKEMFCLTKVYTECRHYTNPTEKWNMIQNRHLYHRDQRAIEKYVRDLHDKPVIAQADWRRVAHAYWENREEIGMAAARNMEISQHDWPVIEEILFDKERMRSYCHRAYLLRRRDFWAPTALPENKEIQSLVRQVDIYRRNVQFTRKRNAWDRIHGILFNEDELYLGPILKRFAVRPMPAAPAAAYVTKEHAAYRLRMLDWITDTVGR